MLLLVLLDWGCGPTIPGPDGATNVPLSQKYRNRGGSNSLWLVEWEPTEKVRLQTLARQGIVPVTFKGGDLVVLRECTLPGEYRFTPSPKIKNREYIRNKTELFAKLPLGAVSLNAEFQKGDVWSLDYVLVGSRDASLSRVHVNDLSGPCREATHFIQGMVVGAYRLSSAATIDGGAGAEALKARMGGGHGSEMAIIREEGNFDGCTAPGEAEAGSGCNATIKLFLEPVQGKRDPTGPAVSKTIIDLGELEYLNNELIFFPHFVFPTAGLSTMELGGDLPPGIQRQWSAMMKGEQSLLKTLIERVVLLNEVDGKRKTCLSMKTGCVDQHKFAARKADINTRYDERARQAKSSLQGKRRLLTTMLRRELERRRARKANTDSVVVALAAIAFANHHETLLEAPVPSRNTAEAPTEEMTLLEGVVEGSRADSAVGWWARYLLGNQLLETSRIAEGIEHLASLVDTPWRREMIHVLFVLGNYYMEAAGEIRLAQKTYLQMAEVARKFGDVPSFGIATVLSALASFQLGRYADALAMSLSILEDPTHRSLHPHLSALAAECVEHLGGFEKETLKEASPQVFAQIAVVMAERAVVRRGIDEASAIWQALLDRAPDSIHAAVALEGLIACAKRRGETALSRRLAKERAERFSVDSEWAENLRKQRDDQGYPTDEEISVAVSAQAPSLPSPPAVDMEYREDALARLDGLYSHCLAAATPKDYSELSFTMEITCYDDNTIHATVSHTHPEQTRRRPQLEAARACFERDAPRYFRGIHRSFRTVIVSAD